jgi:hypothetical protein
MVENGEYPPIDPDDCENIPNPPFYECKIYSILLLICTNMWMKWQLLSPLISFVMIEARVEHIGEHEKKWQSKQVRYRSY